MGLKLAVGGRETDSFCSLEEGQKYIELLGFELDDWDDLSQEQKEFCFQMAALAMDYFPWRGRKSYCGQRLCFPRTCQDDVTQYPVEVKQAQAQIAYNVIFRALQALATQPAEDGPQSDSRVKRVSLGGLLDVWFDSDPAKSGTTLERLTRSIQWPIYLALQKFTSQIRGWVPGNKGVVESCSTTTTTTSTTTTTTTSTTTTT